MHFKYIVALLIDVEDAVNLHLRLEDGRDAIPLPLPD